MHDTPLITAISLGLVFAFILGTLAQRFKLSPLVGYLLAGVAASALNSSSALDLNLDPEMIEQLAELGVILLMFGVGLHFSAKDLMSVKNISLPGAIVQILLATILGSILAYWGLNLAISQYNASVTDPASQMSFKYGIGGAIVFGLALSTASTVVLIRALEERSVLVTERGKIAVGWLIVEDIACVLLLVILPILSPIMGGKVSTTGAESIGYALVKTTIFITVFVILMFTVGRKAIPWTLERVASLGSKELFTLSVLAIALGVALGAALLFGVSLALGAFFAGMMLNESELSHEAASDSLPLRDAFAVLFFVSVGMQLDLQIFIQHPFLLLLTFLIIVVGKSIGAYALVRMFHYSRETALTVAISLAQIGEFAFIIITLGFSLNLVEGIGKSLVLSTAILSIIANPFLFKLLDRWLAKRTENQPTEDETKREKIETALIPIPEQDHAIIVGFGRVGNEICNIIKTKNIPFVVIEADSYIAETAIKKGIPTVIGNAAADATFCKANPKTAHYLFIASAQPFESAVIVERITKANPAAIIVARAETDAAVDYLLNQGAHGAVMEKKELAFSMTEMAMAGERLAQRGMWPPAPPKNPELETQTEATEHSESTIDDKDAASQTEAPQCNPNDLKTDENNMGETSTTLNSSTTEEDVTTLDDNSTQQTTSEISHNTEKTVE